jgi:hypothetical protein
LAFLQLLIPPATNLTCGFYVLPHCRYASTYQMLRGTLVLFAGAFTILILRRQLFIHNWLGMVLITAGAALVGASSVIYQDTPGTHNNTLLAGPAAAGFGVAGDAALAASLFGNGTASAAQSWGSSLHYSAGISRVTSRGLLGWGQADAAAATVTAAGGLPAGAGVQSSSWLGGLVGVLRLRESSGADVAAAPLFGDLLVVAAQMFTALQFIMEEKFLVKYKVGSKVEV